MGFLNLLWRVLDSVWLGIKSIGLGIGQCVGYLLPFKTNSNVSPGVR